MRHRPERRSTRSSRSRVSALFLAAIVAGCAAPEKVSVAPQGEAGEVPLLESIEFDRLDPFDDLALVYGEDTLFLGGDRINALAVFEPLDKSVSFNALPPLFSDEHFAAFGWETDDFAFGAVTYKVLDPKTMRTTEVVVQAMYTQDDVGEDVVQAVLDRYREMYKEPASALPGDRVGYWFWSKPGRRLMVNTAVDPRGRKSLTVAVGETQTMTLLGMDPQQAKADKDKAIQRLSAAAEGE
jgi:hypothetical protein